MKTDSKIRKGDLTREKIIQQAAVLFNRNGYAGAPLSELMQVTGLKKGGIYNHFQSKEEILIEAFRYSIALVQEKIREAMQGKTTAKGLLLAVIEFYRDYPMKPVVKGGCPVLNSMVYSDNSYSEFRENVKKAVDKLIGTLTVIISSGIQQGEFKKTADAKKSAVLIFTAIEGGVAISRNYEDNEYMSVIIDHLHSYVERELSV